MKVSEVIADQQKAANGNVNKDIWGSLLYNVKVYGANGNGVSDEAGAISAAIAAADEGSVIYFPSGTYKVNTPILVNKKHLTFTGPGKITSGLGNGDLTKTYEFQPYLFKVQADFVSFIGLTITNPVNYTANGALYVTANNFTVENCNIDNFTIPVLGKNGYKAFIARGNFITNVKGEGTENYGDGIATFCRLSTVVGNYVSAKIGTDPRCGIVFDIDARYSSMSGNVVEGPFRRSYHIEISPYSTCVGNTGIGATQYGIIIVNDIVTCEGNVFELSGTASYTGNPPLGICVPQWFRNITIVGNTVTGSTGTNDVGIQVNGYYNIISKNQIIGPANNFSTGIYVQGNNASVEDNIVDDGACRGRGIWVYECNGSRIRGNRVTGCDSHGINLTNSINCAVAENISINNNGVGIILENSHNAIVTENHCFDDQGTKTQTSGIGSYTSNNVQITSNYVAGNLSTNLIPQSGGTSGFVQDNIGYNPLGNITPPAIPTSGAVYTNSNPEAYRVFVSGGTVSAININGIATGLTSGSFLLYPRDTITLVYTVVPTWKWMGL